MTDGCWEWLGNKNRKGYGGLTVFGRPEKAHRFAWIITHGFIPAGLQVCHTCDNPSCVNPQHLWLGTSKENVDDCHNKNRHAKFNGSKSGMAKLTESIVLKLIREVQAGKTYTQLAKEHNVYRTTISRAVNKVTWHHKLEDVDEYEQVN